MLALSACKKSEIYSDIPVIEFKNYYFTLDTTGGANVEKLGIIISYKDGDGDIGLGDGDNDPPFHSDTVNGKETNVYHYNLYEEFFELDTATQTFKRIIKPNTTDSLVISGRVGNITPDGKHKAIRGDIDWQNDVPKYPEMSGVIKVRIRIYDRALHESNTVESPEIVLP
ncbi:MAG: hypothetical protein V4590_09915 [Bacteroidota bacterium]